MDVTLLQAQFIRSYWGLIFVALGMASLLFVSGSPRPLNGRAFLSYGVMLIWSLVCRYAARFSRRWAITALALGMIPLLAIFLSAPEFNDLLEIRAVGRAALGVPSTLIMGLLWGWPGALVTIVMSVIGLGGLASPAEMITSTTLLAIVGFSGASMARLIRRLERVNQQLEEAATLDVMTGLNNRRKLDKLGQLHGQWLITMWDVDGLKRINDSQGHAAGDQYLLNFARALQSATAADDQLFRIGGDEFMGLHQNFKDAESLRSRVRRSFPNVSVGWALVEGRDLSAAMLEADEMLYAHKQNKAVEPPAVWQPPRVVRLERRTLS